MDASNPWDPGDPRNRDRTRASRGRVRALLIEWDPIGVAAAPEAVNEYDCMISPLMHKLFEGASAEALAGWINEERREHFGMRPDPVADSELAVRLVGWWAVRETSG